VPEPPTVVVLRPVAELAALDRVELAAALAPLWEDAAVLADLLVGRSFSGWAELVDAAEAEIARADEATRVALLRAHPRLGADPVGLRRRSATSWAEQGGDRRAEPDLDGMLAELNDRYEERFGFPFVAWVAGRPLRDMIAVLEERMTHRRDEELQAGCEAMVAIARDRLGRIEGERA